MAASTGIGSGSAGGWYRVQAVTAGSLGGSADADYASVLPAALNAARCRRPFIAGWLSRGRGTPLELITNAGPLPAVGGPQEDGGQGDGRPAPDDAAGAEAASTEELLFPWDGRGAAIAGNMLADLDQLVWAACPGRQVPVGTNAQPPRPADGLPGPSLFESALQALMGRPFGWLIVADPTDLLDAEIAELRSQLNMLRMYEEEQARFDTDRIQRRLAELDTYREAGLWNVRVLVGAGSEADLQLIAPLLVGSVDLTAHPYRLRCPAGAQEFTDVLAARLADPHDGSSVPFSATAGALTALTGLPRREVPGVRVLQPGYFDVTSEAGIGPGIELGEILDGQDRPVGTLSVPLSTLNRHTLVTGATGAGKSQSVRHMLEQLTRAGIGWLAVEPVKSEYPAMAWRMAGTDAAEVTVINPADPESVPLSVNPLAPEPGYPVQAHIDMIRALFLAAFDAKEPFPQIMAQALQRAYEECGWDPLTGAGQPDAAAPPAVPTLERLQAAALAVIEDVGYGKELQADVRGFVDVRLRSLRTGSAGRFFEGGHPVDIAALLSRNVVLALEDVANDEDKAFVIGTLVIRLVEHLRLRAKTERAVLAGGDDPPEPPAVPAGGDDPPEPPAVPAGGDDPPEPPAVPAGGDDPPEPPAVPAGGDDPPAVPAGGDTALAGDAPDPGGPQPRGGLRHVIVLEEAHRLLRAGREGASAYAVELFAGLLAEIRAYGEGIIIAEQIPAKLVPDAVKNTALKVLHRLPAADDRQLVGATMNLDPDQSRHVVSLPPGEAAVFAEGMDRPLRIRVPYGGQRERPADSHGTALVAELGAAGPAEAGPAAGQPPLLGRRSAGCGHACQDEWPCTLVEIRAADLVARSPQHAWLRVWAEVYVLAHLVNRPRPRVPVTLRERWAGLDRRLRECALATALDRSVLGREQALRTSFDPREMLAVCAASAAEMLDGGKGAGAMPGTAWVIPQLKWLHEIERLCPLHGPAADPFAVAPPLDHVLPGLSDRSDVKIGQRVSELRRHPLSMEVTRNRLLAWTALLGEDDQRALIEDLGDVAIGVSHRGQLGKAAGEMGVAGWLASVLSWPRRFIVGADDQASVSAARKPAAVSR
jgi:Bacterial protein of unknown function (DUF853)